MMNPITQNKRQHGYHPWERLYNSQCIKAGCNEKTYWDGKVYYSLCLSCLKEEELGPFRRRIHKEDYSTLFFLTDYERRNTQNDKHKQ